MLLFSWLGPAILVVLSVLGCRACTTSPLAAAHPMRQGACCGVGLLRLLVLLLLLAAAAAAAAAAHLVAPSGPLPCSAWDQVETFVTWDVTGMPTDHLFPKPATSKQLAEAKDVSSCVLRFLVLEALPDELAVSCWLCVLAGALRKPVGSACERLGGPVLAP